MFRPPVRGIRLPNQLLTLKPSAAGQLVTMIVTRAGILRVLSRWSINSFLVLILSDLFLAPAHSSTPRKGQTVNESSTNVFEHLSCATHQNASCCGHNSDRVPSLSSTFLS